MANIVYTNVSVVINSVDLSDHVVSVRVNESFEVVDATKMGDTARSRLQGLVDWSIDIEFRQDFAASKVDATMAAFPAAGATITVKPTTAAVSATNPSYAGTAILESYGTISGTVGEDATVSARFVGSGALTRATV